jgi:thiol-disulfide isomerase/thioredoxin/tetratricopeptide (TPR) repeat protein
MKRTIHSVHPFTALVIGFVLMTGCVVTPDTAAAFSAVTVERPDGLESAISQVKALFFSHDFHHGAAVGEAALERWPESTELEAWTLGNLSRSSGFSLAGAEQAVARAKLMVESRPDDVWGEIALAIALTRVSDPDRKVLEASLRALELAPTMPEAVWVRGYVLEYLPQTHHEIAVLIDEKWSVVDQQWPELLILKAGAYLGIPDRMDEGLEILSRMRELDPKNVNAHYLPGNTLIRNPQRMAEGIALLEQAAALSPGSLDIARSNWQAISNQPGLEEEEKVTLILASTGEFLDRRGEYPAILQQVSSFLVLYGNRFDSVELKEKGEVLEERVLAEFAEKEGAELVLSSRWQRLSRQILRDEVEDIVAARAELSSMLWSFINRPHHYSQLGQAYWTLFNHSWRVETVSADTLLLLARGAEAHYRNIPHASLANGLAERGAHLDAARQIAMDGFDALEEYISNFLYGWLSPVDLADLQNGWFSDLHAAISYVELKAGDLLAAREAMDRALALKPDSRIQFRAGALAEAEGNIEMAESHYALGEREERPMLVGNKPNREALERIYSERHGTMDGLEEYIDGIMVRDSDRRRQRVADNRIAEPRDLPAIDLEWLNGGRIGAEELKGRIVVINFWGTWCGPCVAEAPQIQQLHEKYRDDPDVVFLTINTFDPDLDKVRSWMADNNYDWPVLVNDNFVSRYGVSSYPTTWFADRDGRIVFEHIGASAAVFEEFVWRVEMLQAEDGS